MSTRQKHFHRRGESHTYTNLWMIWVVGLGLFALLALHIYCNLQCRLLVDFQIMWDISRLFLCICTYEAPHAEVDLSLAPPTVSTCVTSITHNDRAQKSSHIKFWPSAVLTFITDTCSADWTDKLRYASLWSTLPYLPPD